MSSRERTVFARSTTGSAMQSLAWSSKSDSAATGAGRRVIVRSVSKELPQVESTRQQVAIVKRRRVQQFQRVGKRVRVRVTPQMCATSLNGFKYVLPSCVTLLPCDTVCETRCDF